MSKIGKQPINIPDKVNVEIKDRELSVEGPRGKLSIHLPRPINIELKDQEVRVTSKGKSKNVNALWGTYRALVNNMVKGVTEGWRKELELVGTGYRAELQGKTLTVTVGYSHPIKFEAPEGIEFNAQKTMITISGNDKEKVGQVAAEIRSIRPPEPYKGKGIRYKDEYVRRKPGKAAKAQGSPA